MTKICTNCKCDYKPSDSRSKFCSQSCAAIYNNSKRTITDDTKSKISSSLTRELVMTESEFIDLYETYNSLRQIIANTRFTRRQLENIVSYYNIKLNNKQSECNDITLCSKHNVKYHKSKYCKKCSVENVAKRRKKLKIKSVEYKGGCCEKCGYDKCIEALEFHHLDPSEKDFSVSSGTKSWERIKNELDKCIMVCANCHREIHYELRQNK